MSQDDQPGQPVPHQPPPGVPPVLPSPAAVPPPQVPAGLPFDFYDYVRQTGGNTSSLFRAVHYIDKRLPRGPIIVHSERSGEDVR
jgi:hypothetical protein